MQTEQVDLNANMHNRKKEEFRVHLIESIEDDTDKRFREITERMFGKKKGALSIAGEIAIREWISRNDTQIRF